MPENRFFTDQLLKTNKTIVLAKDEVHHLKVMRLSKHSLLELVNGKNQLAYAEIKELKKNQAILQIKKLVQSKPAIWKLTLAMSLIKPAKMELIIEKATELGVHEFILFPADLSEAQQISDHKKERFKAIAIAALKQCGRLDLPTITYVNSLKKTAAGCKLKMQKYFGDLSSDALNPIQNGKFLKPEQNTNIICFIGPEKGFTEDETIFFKKELKAQGIKLSENILRAETAAIAAAALLLR